MMDWQRLLSGRRIGKELADPSHRPRSSFQVDHDRIIFSSAFRRLQDKTQVFPLAESDYVRTRLTHSLEVACVGRSLGTLAGRKIKEAASDIHESDIGAIVAAAALAHDLGNPPFGHSGEQAIRHWFKTSPIAQPLRSELTEKELADIDRYEGNAHAFRVVTALQMPDNRGGMQLTYATLGAVAKYPLESHVPGIGMSHKGASTKKFNFFQTEKSLFEEVATQTGLIRRKEDAAWWCRHPLAFLVEAADDICYHLIDLEDGYRSGIIPFDEIRATFLDLIGEPKTEQRLDGLSTRDEQVQFLRAKAIGRIVSEAAASFTTHEPELLAGEFDQPLISVIPSAARLERIGAREREAIYCHPKVVEVEAAGYEVLGGLLDTFVEAADEAARKGKHAQHRARTLLRLVPEQFTGAGGIVESDPYLRLLKLLDFVAGMTDSYAVSLYRRIRGISLPGRFA